MSSSFSVLMCNFYISALVGVLSKLDNMHSVTMKIKKLLVMFDVFLQQLQHALFRVLVLVC